MGPPLSVLCVPVACPTLHPCQDSIWKNTRPLVSLLQISGGRVAEFIDTFEKTAGEGIMSSEHLFSSSFGVYGNCSAQIRCDPNFCTAVLDPYTLRPLTGLHGDQMDEILLYMAGDGAKIAGLHAKARLLKRDRLWEMLYLHPDNSPSILLDYVYGAAGSGAIAVDPPPPRTHDVRLFRSQWYQWSPVLTVNVHEMQRVRKLLAKSPRAAKLSLGKWTLSAENPLPSWDTIQKAPLWPDEEWADLRIALARPVKETAVTTTDGEKSTSFWPNKPQDGTAATGARAEAIALVPGKAILYTIALREYKAVCNH